MAGTYLPYSSPKLTKKGQNQLTLCIPSPICGRIQPCQSLISFPFPRAASHHCTPEFHSLKSPAQNSPSNPHSALASGGTDIGNIDSSPPTETHVLYGGVVGGPDRQDRFFDIRSDWPETEVRARLFYSLQKEKGNKV